MTGAFPPISAVRLNGLVLLLCAMALASPLVEPVPGKSAYLFWFARAIGVAIAVAALIWPRIQSWALAGVAAFLVVAPCALQMHYRAWTGPHTWCHDSVVQFEEAIQMLRHRKNPYTQEFASTSRWKLGPENPAVQHFVYPPLLLYFSVPVEGVSRAILWKSPAGVESLGPRFYDQRLVVLLFFFGLVALAWRHLEGHPHRLAIASLIALNPWVGPFVVEGRNDVAMLFWILAAWVAYETDHPRYGHLLLGLAIGTKTLLLPMLPFVVLAQRKERALCAGLLLAPLVATSLPFLILDSRAFLEDVVGAPAGLGPHPFEIRGWGGLGFANLVLLFGWVKSPKDYFPFVIFQALAYAPVLYYGLRSLRRDPSNANVFLWSVGGVFAVLFFGRFIHDNYIGALLSMAVMAQTARASAPDASSTSAAA